MPRHHEQRRVERETRLDVSLRLDVRLPVYTGLLSRKTSQAILIYAGDAADHGVEYLHLRAAFERVVRVATIRIAPPVETALRIRWSGLDRRDRIGIQHDEVIGVGPLVDACFVYPCTTDQPGFLQTAVQGENQAALRTVRTVRRHE